MKFTKTLATAAALVAATFTAAHAGEKWKVPVGIPTNLPGIGNGFVDWADTLNAIGGGDIQVKLFNPGKLVPAFAVLDAVRDNKVPAGFHVMAYSAGTIPAGALLTGVPFGLGPREYASWYHIGGGKKLTQDLLSKNGVHGLFCLLIGAETGGWFREPITSVDQFKGLKFRTAGVGGLVYTRLGMAVNSLPFGETLQALEKGTIDAAELSLPSVDTAVGVQKVAKHLYFPGWQAPVGAGHLVINQKVWDGLTSLVKDQIEASCNSAISRNLATSDALQAAALDKARAAGVTIHTYSEEMMDAFRTASAEVLAEQSAADADFKAIYESMEAHKKLLAEWGVLGRVK